MSDFLHQFAHTFATLDKHNLHLLGRLYSEDTAFADPCMKSRACQRCGVTLPTCTATSAS